MLADVALARASKRGSGPRAPERPQAATNPSRLWLWEGHKSWYEATPCDAQGRATVTSREANIPNKACTPRGRRARNKSTVFLQQTSSTHPGSHSERIRIVADTCQGVVIMSQKPASALETRLQNGYQKYKYRIKHIREI